VKVLYQNAKTGEIRLRADTLDDLWHLRHLIAPGDLATASTYRRDDSATQDTSKPTRGEKRRVTLDVRVEAVEFQAFSDRLRISGVIEGGDTDFGQHHTLTLEVRDDVQITKGRWRNYELERIAQAVKATGQPQVAVLSIEEGEAVIAFVHTYGVRQVVEVEARGSGKSYDKSAGRQEFFGDLLAQYKLAMAGNAVPVAVVGPGFTKEDFLKFAKERARGLFDEALIDATSQGGMGGVQEAVRRGTVTRLVAEHRLGMEAQLVEQLLEEVAKDGKATYGPAHVEQALKVGAVDTLLVADEVIRKPEIDRLMEEAASQKARAVVVSSESDAGRRLVGLTGIAALLKYNMT
jgi:protein pelota